MSSEYASRQPKGFKNRIENVAIVGAGGQCGKFIVEEMLRYGKHHITAITRADSTTKIPEGVDIKKVDYNNQSSLVEALRSQDVLIITMAVTAPPDHEPKLAEAAASANVPWIIPNAFGIDTFNEEAARDTVVGLSKQKALDYIEGLGKSSWLGITCGFWYEYSLGGGPDRFGFDFKNRTVTFFDDGTTRLNTSTWSHTGRSVAYLLGLKLLREDADDKSPCLTDFQNKHVFVSSFTVSQKDMFESVLRVTCTREDDWRITYRPVKEVFQEGVEKMQSGNWAGIVQRLYSRMFFPDSAGNFEARRGLDNDKLRLPKEDLDEYTKVAVQLAENEYFADRLA